MVGERANVTGSPKFARLIKEEDYEGAVSIALQQVENGANIIDVNFDEGLLDSEACMKAFPKSYRVRTRGDQGPSDDRQLQVVRY